MNPGIISSFRDFVILTNARIILDELSDLSTNFGLASLVKCYWSLEVPREADPQKATMENDEQA